MKLIQLLLFTLCCLFLACKDDQEVPEVIAPAILEDQILEAEPATELVLNGKDLDHTLKILLSGEELSISSKSAEQLVISVPESAASGVLSFSFENEDTMEHFLKILDNSFNSKNLDFNTYSQICFFNDNIALLYSNGAVHKTSDGGDSWSKIYENVLISTENTFNVLSEEQIWVSQYGEKELAYSNDGGQTWSEIDALSSDFNIERIFSVGENTVGLAARNTNTGKGYLFIKENGEETWVQKYVSEQTDLYQVKVCYQSVDTVYLLDSKNGLLLKTINGGDSWSETSLGIKMNASIAEAISFIDANTAWAYNIPGIDNVNAPGIYKSNDGGENWQLVFEPLLPHSGEVIKGIHFTNDMEGMAATSKGGYMITEDGGQHWRLYYLSIDAPSFIDFGQSSLYFHSDGKIIRKNL